MQVKKILVTGASGFVGSRFVERWQGEYDIMAPSHAELDITNEKAVCDYIMRATPDVVLHLAALSNTGYCEQHPADSFAVNVLGCESLARAAEMFGAKFIFFSSDQVYNGNLERGLLPESIAVAPETVYGRHKLEAEQRVAAVAPGAVALRATWMYDAPRPVPHADFVHNIAAAIAARRPFPVAVREFRGITWVRDVVENLPLVFSLPGGVYNFGAENSMNTYETTCCFCEMSGEGAQYIVPDYDRFPTHERNISISGEKIFRASGGAICFPSTLDGFRLFLDVTTR